MTAWKPTAPLQNLVIRAQIINKIRNFFQDRQVLEVETPILSQFAATDPHLDSFRVNDHFLQTSPEFPMKRLVAAGSGAVFQICKVFRQDEAGKRHNPEFTMLEWYQPGYTDQQLWQEAIALISCITGEHSTQVISYRDAFISYLQVDPLTAELSALKQLCHQYAGAEADNFSRDDCLDLLISIVIEPGFNPNQFTVLHRFPASQAALAKKTTDPDGEKVSHRFEIFFKGMELANGYWELTNAKEQKDRFDDDNRRRVKMGKQPVPVDKLMLDALENGLPDCAGIAMGIDRLIMIACHSRNIKEVLSFSWENA
ncbi:EF-P lysine aminoacylase EpmA [Gynuella sunshinyii]|uniref:Lysyl-tRNA synthetase-like protein n=1 Tax=Gynuella sunshinyii YC6258 TaxID=1445510 RepID=A0A0C5V4I3_9GAMM|nr:EF-P lysine aminoacylase EpmA [Gynuella sunshinyii]AJQ94390.1 lysyl-tRNA synthetase-like protein [Gynuella sunshinyii YC6258]